jgi:hypothetical protein
MEHSAGNSIRIVRMQAERPTVVRVEASQAIPERNQPEFSIQQQLLQAQTADSRPGKCPD